MSRRHLVVAIFQAGMVSITSSHRRFVMLRKLIVLAITSGLAKKAWDSYKARQSTLAQGPGAAREPTHRRATTVSSAGDAGFNR
jgi:hypothetical protein